MLWVAALALGGCAPAVMTTRIGTRYPSKEPDCKLRFDYGDPMKAMQWMQKYDLVAMIGLGSLSKPLDEWTDDLKEAVRGEACRVGADVVVMMSSSSSSLNSGGGASVHAYRKRAPIEIEKKDEAMSD